LLQPTGGPILLHDTESDKPKELIELKVKKAPTQPAPSSGVGDMHNVVDAAFAARRDALAAGAAGGIGAASAAGVLTAVDEDEDGEEAELPGDFEYETEGEDGDDD